MALAANALVLMPDVFEGGLPPELFAERHTPEAREKLAKFRGEGGPAHMPKVVGQINDFAISVKSKYPSVSKLAALGFCLGGKVSI